MKLTLGAVLVLCLSLAHCSVAKTLPDAKRIVCYHTSWSSYRENHKFYIKDINSHLCTHLLYAYAALDEAGNLVPFDTYQDLQLEGFTKLVDLKKDNPDLKVILSVGGSKQGPVKFSKISNDANLRAQFAKSSLAFLKKFGFDGLDMVWKYPNSAYNPVSEDKPNYVKLVKELRETYGPDYSISIALPPFQSEIERGFDLPNLSSYLDFMTVLTYDYHKATEPTLGHIAPLYSTPDDSHKELSVDSTISTYLKLGADPAKLNMAIALYGLSFALDDPNKTSLGDPSEDEGTGTQERGTILYNQFCNRLKGENWTVKRDDTGVVGPYAYKGSQWISYDDEDIIRKKARYALEKKLGGIMFWTIDMDDFTGNICDSAGTVKYPLIKAAREEFIQ